MGKSACAFQREHIGRHVHALTRERQQEAKDLASVALMLSGRGYRCITPNAALPDGIADLGLAMWLPWNSKIAKEKEINEGIDQLLGQRLGVLKLFYALGLWRLFLGFIK